MNLKAIVVGGIVASLAIAMWEMVVEALLPDGAGFFGPPIAIGATIVRDLQGSGNPIQFDALALILGLAGHMMNSIVLAAVFGAFVVRRGLRASGMLVAGLLWAVAVFIGMWFIVVPAVDPLVRNLNAAAFLAGHLMWGAALGLLWRRFALGDSTAALRSA